MPQMQLPIFPPGVTHITSELAFECRDDTITYFNGFMPVFSHDKFDVNTFRMITAQFCVTGHVKQSQIVKTFGVSTISVKRSVKRYRESGSSGFYKPGKKRGATVLTEDVLIASQRLLDEGDGLTLVSQKLGLKRDTLRKAINQGRLHKNDTEKGADVSNKLPCITKSERSTLDGSAPMGMGATDTLGRVLASMGMLNEVQPSFKTAMDVPNGGVLLALPCLLVCGLLGSIRKHFSLPAGYYGIESIFLLLSFMALARIKSVESLRYIAPGEWGKILGLDRIPEVRTLRNKIGLLSTGGDPAAWSSELCRTWMEDDPQSAKALYIDGHVRVYNGHQTTLPRHYVARQRLCLRATTDYWVNAMDGQPFFVISKEVDPGLLKVLEDEIVPCLEKDVPHQPSEQMLKDNPLIHRFCLIFDREGYSPDFINRMKDKHIACLTYHKHPGEDWPRQEFISREVRLNSGEMVKMELAERGTHLSGKVWVREIRKLTESGHQTSILSTNYTSDLAPIAAAMFARWSQENFFAYMREHYGLDRVISYETEDIPDTTRVVNPAWRQLDGEIRSKNMHLYRQLAKFGEIQLHDPIEPAHVKKYQHAKAKIKDEITGLQEQIQTLKIKRSQQNKHIETSELPKSEKFKRLQKDSKHFIDTIKMIAYRAETSMAYTIREKMSRTDDARALLRGIYSSEVDIVPDAENKTVTIRIHHSANRCGDEIIKYLCEELNATETIFPGSQMKISYEMVS